VSITITYLCAYSKSRELALSVFGFFFRATIFTS